MNANSIRNIVGILGNFFAFGLFISPFPTFVQICQKKVVEQFSPTPYMAGLINCMLWVFYGLPVVHPNSLLVATVNGVGVLLEAIYLTIFLIYSPKELKKKVLMVVIGELVFMVAVVVVVLTTTHSHDKRSLIIGILAIIFSICMYASPLSVMKLVVKTKSVKYMPFWLSLASFLNGVCWTLYALIKFDIFILIPNGIGALFAFLQLFIYMLYCRNTPTKEQNVKEIKLETV